MTRPSGRSPELVAKAPVATTTIRVLGPLEVVPGRAGDPARECPASPSSAVLLAHANEIVWTDRLLEALWGEGSRAPGSRWPAARRWHGSSHRCPGSGRRSVTLRLQTHPAGYRFVVERDELDASRFETLVRVGLTSTDRPMTAVQAFDDTLRVCGAAHPTGTRRRGFRGPGDRPARRAPGSGRRRTRRRPRHWRG